MLLSLKRLEPSWEGPFWSILIILRFSAQLCFCVCNCFRDAHLHTVSYIACLIFPGRWQCSRSTWNHFLFAWAQAAKGPRQRLSKVQRHVHTIFKFLPAVPWLTYKGHTVWECKVLSVCLTPSYTVAYIHTYNVSSLYWSYNSASKWRATNIGDYFGLSWVCIACFGPWSRKSRRYVWHCPGQLWQEARVAAADWHAYATGQSFAAHSKDLQSFLWTCAKVSHRLNLPKCGWWQCKKSCMKGIHTGVDSDPKMIKHVH